MTDWLDKQGEQDPKFLGVMSRDDRYEFLRLSLVAGHQIVLPNEIRADTQEEREEEWCKANQAIDDILRKYPQFWIGGKADDKVVKYALRDWREA